MKATRVLLLMLLASASLLAQTKPWVSAYFTGYGGMKASEVDYSAMSVVIDFAVVVNSNGSLDATSNGVTAIAASSVAAAHASGVKAIVSFGGAGNGTQIVSAVTNNLSTLVTNMVSFVKQYGYDGLDIDEEPVTKEIAILVQALRAQLPSPQYMITTYCNGESVFGSCYQYFDQINVNGYDLAGPWQGWVSWYNGALYMYGHASTNGAEASAGIDVMVNDLINAGVPTAKIGIGSEFGGAVWQGVTGPNQTPTSNVSYDVPYNTIKSYGGTYTWDPQAQASSTVSSHGWATYDDSMDIAAKLNYVKTKGLGGLFVWSLDMDHKSGTIGQDPLLNAIKANWGTNALPPAPAAPTILLPANNTTNQSVNNLVFKWSTSSTATKYLFQLSLNNTFSSFVVNDTNVTDTTTSVSALTNSTKYYWRVSAYNAGGYGAFSSVDSFTTIIAAPAPPTVLVPPNNSTNQRADTLAFKWSTSSTATKYLFQLSSSGTFSSYVVNDSNVTDTTRTVTGLANLTKYFWRVSAYNAGGYSTPSTVAAFTTIIAAPVTPTALLPANGSTNQSVNNLVFKWSTSSTATNYVFQLSSNNMFSSYVVNDSTLSDTTRTVSGLANLTPYYWRVTAYNAGGYSTPSTVATFTTIIAAPGSLTILVPTNTATNQRADTLVFKWTSNSTATKYLFQLSSSGTFASYVVNDSNVADTTTKVTGLANSTKYFCRVSAYNAGGYGTFSQVDTFTTIIAIPAAPTVLLPPNNSVNQRADTLAFKWSTSSTATKYLFQLSPNGTFSSYVVNDSNVTDTTRTVTGLTNLTKYFCRVSAYNAGGYSAFSPVDTFTTIIAIAPPPPVVPPAITSADTFYQTITVPSSIYELQLATSATFDSVETDTIGQITGNYTFQGLAPSTNYYWRFADIGVSTTWGTVYGFTTPTPRPSNVAKIVVYDDSLHSPWTPAGWGGKTSFNNTTPVYAGQYSIRLTAGAWGSLPLDYGRNASDTVTGVDSLSFAIYLSASVPIAISGDDAKGHTSSWILLGSLPANIWQQFTIPVAAITPKGYPLQEVIWQQETSGNLILYFDSIYFK